MGHFVKPITFKVPEEIKGKLDNLAEQERRPLSNLIRNIVIDWLKQQQHKKKPSKIPE